MAFPFKKNDDKGKPQEDGKKPDDKSKAPQDSNSGNQPSDQKGTPQKSGDPKQGGKPGFVKPGEKGSAKQTGASKDKVEKPEITTTVKVDFEPKITNEELNYLFDGDLSETAEFTPLLDELKEELKDIGEEITISTRLRRASSMRRSRNRIRVARVRALKRRATTDKIKGRARRSAISNLKRKFAGGRSPEDLTYSEKARVERMAHSRQTLLARATRRLIRPKRELETHRLSGR